MVKKYKGDLGKQRLFGVVGQAVFVSLFFIIYQLVGINLVFCLKSMLAGIVLDWTKERSGSFPYFDFSFLNNFKYSIRRSRLLSAVLYGGRIVCRRHFTDNST